MAKTGDEQINFKKGQLKELIFAALGIGLVVGGSIVLTPNFPIVVGTLIKIVEELKKKRIPKDKIRRAMRRLEKRKILALDRKGEEVIVKVLAGGKVDILKHSIKELLMLKKKKKKWERKWFLVVFDVPEDEKNKREYLRRFLQSIGFFQYQKSVYVYPYECEKEIALVKKIVEGGKYINYIVADEIENEEHLKGIFKLG